MATDEPALEEDRDVLREEDVGVEDDGPGIPPQDRGSVFQRFVRGSNATGEGSGLGLAIVRQVAELHGGRVALAESGSAGLRIVIVLPRGPRTHLR